MGTLINCNTKTQFKLANPKTMHHGQHSMLFAALNNNNESKKLTFLFVEGPSATNSVLFVQQIFCFVKFCFSNTLRLKLNLIHLFMGDLVLEVLQREKVSY